MNGVYSRIIRQAFYLTKDNKFLWSAGLFLVWLNLFRSLIILASAGSIFENTINMNWGQAVQPSQVQGKVWIGVVSILVIFFLVIYFFKYKAAVILAVKKLKDARTVDFSKILEESDIHTISLLKIGLWLALAASVITAIFFSPVFYLQEIGNIARSSTLGLVSLVIYIPIIAGIYYGSVFSPMFVVMQNMSITNGLRASVDYTKKLWPSLLLLSLLLFGIELIGLVLSVALALLGILPFVLLGQLFYDMNGSTITVVLQGLAGLTGFMVFFMSQAIIAVFQRVAWSVAFLEMVRPQKTEEEAPAVEAATEAI